MELNQSSSVPFAVNDPITGTDITKDVRLTAIEVGGQPSPYLKPNGDYSFTVVGADETDLTEEATFKLEVDWEGSPFPLEAKTDVTVKGTTASQLVVRIVGSFDGHERVLLTNGFMVQFQVSYHGRLLGAGEIGVNNTVNTNSGLGIEYKGVLEDGVTHRMDVTGVELGDSKWFMVHVFRPEEPTKTVVLQGYADVVASNATDLRIWIEPRYRTINGVKGDKQIVFCKYYRGVNPVAYNAPGMSVRLAGNVAADDAGVKFIEALPEGLVGEFLPEVSVKTNYIINVVMVYNGVTARSGTSWYCHKRPAAFPTQFGILPKYKVLANSDENWVWQVTDLNYPDNYDASNRPTAKGAIIEKGELVGIDMVTFANLYKEPFTNIPLNSLKQFATRHAVDYRKQTYNIQAMYLKVRFEAETPLWEKQWQYGRLADYGDVIEAAPVVAVYDPKVIDGRTEGFTPILLKAQQQRGDDLVTLPGTYQLVSQTGAGTIGVSQHTNDKNELFYVSGKGVNGDFQATYEFTPTETAVGKQTFVINLVADTAPVLKMIPGDVQTVMFQEFTAPPFQVLVNNQNVSGQIKNVQLVPNNVYLKTDPNNPNKWSVADNPGKLATSTRGVFTYEVLVDGVWETHVGYGQYRIPAWDGITFKVSADYGRGVGVTTEIPISRNNTNRFTVWPVYKGKPLSNGFSGTVQIGAWFTAPITIVGPAPDGIGVIIEYTAPNTSGAASNSSTLTLTIDGTPGTTVNVNKWVGNFTGIYVTKGLYVLPITLVPSTQVYARPLSWDAKIYYGGVLLKPNDPRLSMEVSNASAVTPPIFDIIGIEDRYVWFAFNRKPDAAASFTNRIMVTYNDGINPPETSGYANIQASYSTTNLVPVTLKALKEPLGNAENIIPVEFQRSGYSVAKPTTVLSLSGKDDPSMGNALLGELELIDAPGDIYRNALKFKSGWTGGKVIVNMVAVFPDLADNWVLRDSELIIPPALITVTPSRSNFEGFKGSSTEVKFTLSQERLIDSSVVQYDFADATIANTAVTTGPIQSVEAIKNVNGEFSANFIGGGGAGDVTAEFTITDTDGFSYKVVLAIEATVDSSGMTFTLDKTSITGVTGYQETINGTLSWNGSQLNMADADISYTVEPAGYGQVVSKSADNITIRVIRDSFEDEVAEVTITANWSGRKDSVPFTINIEGNLTIEKQSPNVKVWDKLTGIPFTINQSNGGTITPIDVVRLPNENILEVTPVGTYQIVSEVARPAGPLIVTWEYRLPSDPEGIKRTVEITYNVAEYDGNELTFTVTGTRAASWGSSSWIQIKPLYRGEQITKQIKYMGYGEGGSKYVTYKDNIQYTGQIRIDYTVKSGIFVIDGVQYFALTAVGGYPGNPSGEMQAPVEFTTYNPNYPFQVSPWTPSIISGKYGDTFVIRGRANHGGTDKKLTEVTWLEPVPNDVIELVPGSITDDSFTVRFIKDIDVNSKETVVQLGFSNLWGSSTLTSRSGVTVTQTALQLKLTPTPGFQSTGQGDMENPVTLKQSVLNPE